MATLEEWQRKRDWSEDPDMTPEAVGDYISDCIQAIEETGETPMLSESRDLPMSCLDLILNTDLPHHGVKYVVIRRKVGIPYIDSMIDKFGAAAVDSRAAMYYLYAKNPRIDKSKPHCISVHSDQHLPVSCMSRLLDSWKVYRDEFGHSNFPGFTNMLADLAPTLHEYKCVVSRPAHHRASKDISRYKGKYINCLGKVLLEDHSDSEEMVNLVMHPGVDLTNECVVDDPRGGTSGKSCLQMMMWENTLFQDLLTSLIDQPKVSLALKQPIFIPSGATEGKISDEELAPAPLINGYQWIMDAGLYMYSGAFRSGMFNPYDIECKFMKERDVTTGELRQVPPVSCIDYALEVFGKRTEYAGRIGSTLYQQTGKDVIYSIAKNPNINKYLSDRICTAPDDMTRATCVDKIISTEKDYFAPMVDAVFGETEGSGVNISEAECYIPVQRGNFNMRGSDGTKYRTASCLEKVIDYTPHNVPRVITLIEKKSIPMSIFDDRCTTGTGETISCFDKIVNTTVASHLGEQLKERLVVATPKWKREKLAIGALMKEESNEIIKATPQLRYPIGTLDRIVGGPLLTDENLADRVCHRLAGRDSIGGADPHDWVVSMGRKRKITRESGMDAVGEAYSDLRIDPLQRVSCINRLLEIYERMPELSISGKPFEHLTKTKTDFSSRTCDINGATVPCMQKAIRAAGAVGLSELRRQTMTTRYGKRRRGYESRIPESQSERDMVYRQMTPIISNLDVLEKACIDAAGQPQVCLATIIESVGGIPPMGLVAGLLTRKDFHKMPPIEIVVGGVSRDLKSYVCESGNMESMVSWLEASHPPTAAVTKNQSYNGRALELFANCRGCIPDGTPQSRKCFDDMCFESTQNIRNRLWLEASMEEGEMYKNYGDPLGIAGVYDVLAPTSASGAKVMDYKNKFRDVMPKIIKKFDGMQTTFKDEPVTIKIESEPSADVVNDDIKVKFFYTRPVPVFPGQNVVEIVHTTTIYASEILSRKSPVAKEIEKNADLLKETQRFVTAKPTTTKSKLVMVISRRLADLTRASSCQHWTSCFNQNGRSGEMGTGQVLNLYETMSGYIAYLAPKEFSPTWLARRLIYMVEQPGCVSIQPTYGMTEYKDILSEALYEVLAKKGINTGERLCPSSGQPKELPSRIFELRPSLWKWLSSGQSIDVDARKTIVERCIEKKLIPWENKAIESIMEQASEIGYTPNPDEIRASMRSGRGEIGEAWSRQMQHFKMYECTQFRFAESSSTPMNSNMLEYATPSDLRKISARHYDERTEIDLLNAESIISQNRRVMGENFVSAVRPLTEF